MEADNRGRRDKLSYVTYLFDGERSTQLHPNDVLSSLAGWSFLLVTVTVKKRLTLYFKVH